MVSVIAGQFIAYWRDLETRVPGALQHEVLLRARDPSFLSEPGSRISESSATRRRVRDTAVQKSISRQYSPPRWRSTQYTTSRSSTNTSLIWVVPVGAPATGGGTKVATACGWYGLEMS